MTMHASHNGTWLRVLVILLVILLATLLAILIG
jgi:hypothetical protein